MTKYRWTCAVGHECHEITDDGDAASAVAIRQTRLRLKGGCDHHENKRKCGAAVTEATS